MMEIEDIIELRKTEALSVDEVIDLLRKELATMAPGARISSLSAVVLSA